MSVKMDRETAQAVSVLKLKLSELETECRAIRFAIAALNGRVAKDEAFGTSIGWSEYKTPKQVYHRVNPDHPSSALCRPSVRLKDFVAAVPVAAKYCTACARIDHLHRVG